DGLGQFVVVTGNRAVLGEHSGLGRVVAGLVGNCSAAGLLRPPEAGFARVHRRDGASRYNARFDEFPLPCRSVGAAHAFGGCMSSQYIYTMNGVSKIVPPKRQIIKDISLSFFPGAKIGLLGVNGAGKSTVLKIMAGVDTDFQGEARAQPGTKVGYLAQEPDLNPEKTVREVVEEGVSEILDAQKRLEEVYAAYAEDGADFDKLAKEQEQLENLLAANDAH